MTIKSTGSLSFTDIATEYDAANAKPFKLSQFYRGAGKVPIGTTNVPSSGLIKFSHFYGQSNAIALSFVLTGAGAGGGGGGHSDDDAPLYGGGGGGGGAGSTVTGNFSIQFGSTLSVIVGQGGAGGQGGQYKEANGNAGASGGSTYVSGLLVAAGGGGGGGGQGGDDDRGVGAAGIGGSAGGKSGSGRNGGAGGDSSIGAGGLSGLEGAFGAGGGGGLGGLLGSAQGATGYSGGPGGNGIAVIKYPSSYPKASGQGSSVYTLENGMHTYTFYSAGTFSFTL